MFTTTVSLAALIAVAALLGTGAWRAFRSRRALVRFVAGPLAALFTLVFAALSVMGCRGFFLTHASRGSAPPTLTADRSAERVARGEHIARATCAGCHSTKNDVPLSGGYNLSERAHMPLGDITPFNLTPGGPLKDWTDGEIFRAVRNSADKDGHPLMVMSAQGVRHLSDDDLTSVVAYLRSQPAVNGTTPPEQFSVLAMLFAGANMLPFNLAYLPDHMSSPARAASVDYGNYVVGWNGCRECHGERLTGGGGGVLPKGPNLRVVKGWTREQFLQTLRTGVDPFGKKLDPEMMPWKLLGRLDDDELSAVYLYLNTLSS
jgi:mono/diheme cytochrome c family protein